jgi:imidazolonepropionase-like amidohydrolase
MVPGVSLLDELDALVDAGLTRARALRMATSDAARFLGLKGKAGQVSKGAFADAVLLDANPLENLVALRRPAGVMSAGRWHDRAELDRWLATATKRTPK